MMVRVGDLALFRVSLVWDRICVVDPSCEVVWDKIEECI